MNAEIVVTESFSKIEAIDYMSRLQGVMSRSVNSVITKTTNKTNSPTISDVHNVLNVFFEIISEANSKSEKIDNDLLRVV